MLAINQFYLPINQSIGEKKVIKIHQLGNMLKTSKKSIQYLLSLVKAVDRLNNIAISRAMCG